MQYHMPFYMQYLATWPEYFTVAEAPNGNVMAYGTFQFQTPAMPPPPLRSTIVFVHSNWFHVLCMYKAVFGKAEGRGENWHGHVTAVTVAPEFRRLGLAQQLMRSLEDISEH